MPCHAERELVRQPKCPVEPLREKMEQREAAEADAVGVGSPVNHEAAPDHERQQWEVDPVHPADGAAMLECELLHVGLPASIVNSPLRIRKLRAAARFHAAAVAQ